MAREVLIKKQSRMCHWNLRKAVVHQGQLMAQLLSVATDSFTNPGARSIRPGVPCHGRAGTGFATAPLSALSTPSTKTRSERKAETHGAQKAGERAYPPKQ